MKQQQASSNVSTSSFEDLMKLEIVKSAKIVSVIDEPVWLKEYNEARNFYIWYLVNHSLDKSRKHFEQLHTRIFINGSHQWKVTFAGEIERIGIKIFKRLKKFNSSYTLDFTRYLNDDMFFVINSYQKSFFTLEDVKELLLEKNDLVSFCDKIIGNYDLNMAKNISLAKNFGDNVEKLSKFERFTFLINQIRKINNEQHFEDLQRQINNLEQTKNNKSDFSEQLKSMRDRLETDIDCDFSFAENIEQYLPEHKKFVKLTALFYYLFFLQTKLKDAILKPYDYEVPIFPPLPNFSSYTSFGRINTVREKKLFTYSWKPDKQSDLNRIFKNLNKYLRSGTTLSQFKNIFKSTEILQIEPLWINFSASELLFFMIKLMKNGFIISETMNYEKLRSCFKKIDGKEYAENFAVLKSQLINNDSLSASKKEEISKLIFS